MIIVRKNPDGKVFYASAVFSRQPGDGIRPYTQSEHRDNFDEFVRAPYNCAFEWHYDRTKAIDVDRSTAIEVSRLMIFVHQAMMLQRDVPEFSVEEKETKE